MIGGLFEALTEAAQGAMVLVTTGLILFDTVRRLIR